MATLKREKRTVEEGAWVWCQRWYESEAGWGTRPDGYTLHAQEADVDAFLKDMRKREQKGKPEGHTPSEYSAPSGGSYQCFITDRRTLERIEESVHGVWGPNGNKAPPKGTR